MKDIIGAQSNTTLCLSAALNFLEIFFFSFMSSKYTRCTLAKESEWLIFKNANSLY